MFKFKKKPVSKSTQFILDIITNCSSNKEVKKLVKEQVKEEVQLLKKSIFKNETNLLSNILILSTKKSKPSIIEHNFKKSM